ncbi:MAG: M48 family metallopeptidase, partial [Candidatus Eisenbacteria bacterium]|nr:M48 family metallopeptidase [Candidatus Eisenbacteria bacterium]
AENGQSFRIDDIKYKDDRVVLRMRSGSAPRSNLVVYGRDRRVTQVVLDEVVPAVLTTIFDYGESPGLSPFVGNVQSDVIHSRWCNHLPIEPLRVSIDRVEDGLARGLKRCGVCFSSERSLPLDHYGRVRAAALENARLFKLAFPPLPDSSEQKQIAEVGQEILEKFPVELRGFDYEFLIVTSGLPQAVSFPTGFVYVTSALYDAVESDLELAAILAHEIAHVEFHYGETNETPTVLLRDELVRRARDFEFESDLMALVCLQMAHPHDDVVAPMLNVIRKLQSFAESPPTEGTSMWDTHPAYSDRLTHLGSRGLKLFPRPLEYCGFTEDGTSVGRAHIVGWRYFTPEERERYERGLIASGLGKTHGFQVLLLIEMSDSQTGLEDGFDVAWKDRSGGKLDFGQAAGLSPIGSGEAGIVAAWHATGDGNADEIEEIEIGVADAKKWTPCPSRGTSPEDESAP